MSKPPSKSGGSGRGRSFGGSSRDGSSYGGSSRSGSPRGDSASRYNASGGSRSNRSRHGDDRPRNTQNDGARASYSSSRSTRSDFEGVTRGDKPRGFHDRNDTRVGYRDGPRDGGRTDARADNRRNQGNRFEGGKFDNGRFDNGRSGRRDERGGKPAYGRFGSSEAQGQRRPHTRPGPAPKAAAPTPKDPSLPAREGERIAKLLARAGIASRREVERMIIEGRIKLNDTVIETPSTVVTTLAGITVDGNPVSEPEGTRLFLFHKPSGLITAERDPAGRPTIYSALRNALPENAGRVMPIGRLDLNTEGLLLLTNDGEFKRQLELPATGVPRTYRARTFGDITQSRLEELMEGIEVDGVIYGKINANMERRTGRNQWIEMTLTEGKNREVRRVLEALGLQVSRLIRVSYGPFRLGDLPKGAAGEIAQRDLENFRRSLSEGSA